MANLIGNRKDIKVSSSERQELLRLSEEGRLRGFYKYLMERINEYEIAIWEDRFFSAMTGEEMSMNHLVCMLRNDCRENSGVIISSQLSGKLTTWFLKALVSCCVQSGELELDATVLLSRIDSLIEHTPQPLR
jgi:hypothetical protein